MDAAKFEKIVLMLSSDQAGDVVAAAAAIGRALPSAGLDWHKFAKLVAGRIGPRPIEPERPQYTAPPMHGDAYLTPAEIEILDDIVHHQLSKLLERERSFVESLFNKRTTYGTRTFVTGKQRKWLKDIWEKL